MSVEFYPVFATPEIWPRDCYLFSAILFVGA